MRNASLALRPKRKKATLSTASRIPNTLWSRPVKTSPVTIEKHEPERRRKEVMTLYGLGGGCACTCCCCLHSLGSLIGAAVAPALGRRLPNPITYYEDEETGQPVRQLRKPGLSAVTLFWWILCLLIFLGFAYGIMIDSGDMMGTTLVIVMCFPGLQLVSAFLTLILFACWPRPDKSRQLKQLAKITGGVVAGTIAGILLMIGIGYAMEAFGF